MTVKQWITGTVALGLGLIAYGTLANAATATNPFDSGYYQATKTFKTHLYGTAQNITIPKGTIVQARTGMRTSKVGQDYQVGEMDLLNLNYSLRKTWPRANAGGVANMSAFNKSSLKAVAAPKYMPIQQLTASYTTGAVITRKMSQNWSKDAWLTVTTDGYVAHFAALKKANTRSQRKPDSVAKVTKTKRSGSTLSLYYRHYVKGVPDKRVAKTGKAQYRLTIVTKKEMTTNGDGSSLVNYINFKIGGKNYYTFYNMPN